MEKEFNIIWTEYKNEVIKAKNKKEAEAKATILIFRRELMGDLNDFSIDKVTTDFKLIKEGK